MSIAPGQYGNTPVPELLAAAANGRISFDHRLIRALVDRPSESVPALVAWGLEDHEECPIDIEEDLTSILLYLRAPEALPFYVHCVRLHPEDVPDDLVLAFHTVKDAAVEPLLELYNELGEEEGGEVAFLLASLRVPGDRVLRILMDRLEYDAGDGALALGMYGDPAARPALEKMLASISAEDTHLRADIQDALEQLGRPDEPVDTSYDIWAEYPEKGIPHFDLLGESERLEMLDHPDGEVRLGAAGSFLNRDLSDDARKKLFALASKDQETKVRAVAWQTLAFETENSLIRKAMLERLESRDVPLEERAGALISLANEMDDRNIRSYAEEFYHNAETRAAALEAMWRSLDRSFDEYFPPHLDDPDEDVQRQAINGIGYLGIQSESEKLRQFFTDYDFRADALFAYALSARHELSRGRIHGLLRKVEEAAGGLSAEEEEMVRVALDERLVMHGHQPVFYSEPAAEDSSQSPLEVSYTAGRNDPCPCGSGKKFKRCHGA